MYNLFHVQTMYAFNLCNISVCHWLWSVLLNVIDFGQFYLHQLFLSLVWHGSFTDVSLVSVLHTLQNNPVCCRHSNYIVSVQKVKQSTPFLTVSDCNGTGTWKTLWNWQNWFLYLTVFVFNPNIHSQQRFAWRKHFISYNLISQTKTTCVWNMGPQGHLYCVQPVLKSKWQCVQHRPAAMAVCTTQTSCSGNVYNTDQLQWQCVQHRPATMAECTTQTSCSDSVYNTDQPQWQCVQHRPAVVIVCTTQTSCSGSATHCYVQPVLLFIPLGTNFRKLIQNQECITKNISWFKFLFWSVPLPTGQMLFWKLKPLRFPPLGSHPPSFCHQPDTPPPVSLQPPSSLHCPPASLTLSLSLILHSYSATFGLGS